MMGTLETQKDLFTYHVNLDKRVRDHHPLRAIKSAIDFAFVRQEVQELYGHNGHESLDPEVILKLVFLLFYDNIASERELMRMLPERLDYLWFLGYGLDEPTPHHSVLSKARKRWGTALFQQFFVRSVGQCVAAGLVDGTKIHVDSSLNHANASCDSVVKGGSELITALKAAYQAVESKLEDTSTPESYEAVNARLMSTTDPDSSVVRKGKEPARPRYQHHRAVDDAHGVITAVETTPGSVAENKKLLPIIAQHQANSGIAAQTVVADHKYGTVENFIACQERHLTTHLGDARAKQNTAATRGIFPDTDFTYQPTTNTYRCPAGQTMKARRLHPDRQTWEYYLPKATCAACALRARCTRAKNGRTVHRHAQQALLDRARAQAHSVAGRRDRRRRQTLIEGSFADAANNHGFKRARWRRLWRVAIQDYVIAAVQNIRMLLRHRIEPVIEQAAGRMAVVCEHFPTPENILVALQTRLNAFTDSRGAVAAANVRGLDSDFLGCGWSLLAPKSDI